MPERKASLDKAGPAVAYVLKGFPRLSETFIANEVYRLERTGLSLRLIVLKPDAAGPRHAIVDRIAAPVDYLSPTSSLSGTTLVRWLRRHARDFAADVAAVTTRHPAGVLRAAIAAFAQAVRARRSFWSWPRKVYAKEFLQAAAVARRVGDAPAVRHIHAHFCHGAATVAWLASMMTDLPFSFTAHAKDIYCESLNPAGLLRRKMRAARFVVTCTDANARHLRQISATTPVHRVYHGLSEEFSSLTASLPAGPALNGRVHLLAVGRLVPKKGFDTLIDACALLSERGIGFDATIVGESGEHEPQLRRQIGAHGLDTRIRLAGPMPQAALFDQYRRATVFCLPCRVLDSGDRDGLPNVIVEAMACGVPVVTTDVSGIPEMVTNGVNGLLVAPDDAHALADAVARLDADPALARRLSTAGMRTVRERLDGGPLAEQLAGLFVEATR